MLHQQKLQEEEQRANARRVRQRLLQELEEREPKRPPWKAPGQGVSGRLDWLIGVLFIVFFVALCVGALWATIHGSDRSALSP